MDLSGLLALTLQFSSPQVLLQLLHLALQVTDVSHHVLRRVDLHGDVPGGWRSGDRLVQLLLKNSVRTGHGRTGMLRIQYRQHDTWLRAKVSKIRTMGQQF